MSKIWRFVGGEAVRSLGFEAIKYALPLGAPVVTAIIGYDSGVPWFWIWLGALAAFAFVSTGVLRFDERIVRRRVEGKLDLTQPRAVLIHNQGYSLGVGFHNQAVFPIEVRLIELRTQIDHKVPTEKPKSRTTLIVRPNHFGWFNDNPIKFDPPKPGSIEGMLEAKLKYGSVGSSLKYGLEEKRQLTAQFDDDGKWAGNAIWADVIEG